MTVFAIGISSCFRREISQNKLNEKTKVVKSNKKKSKVNKSGTKAVVIVKETKKPEDKTSRKEDEVVAIEEDLIIIEEDKVEDIDNSDFIKILKDNGIEVDTTVASGK